MSLKKILIPALLLLLIVGGLFAYKLSQDSKDTREKSTHNGQEVVSVEKQNKNQSAAANKSAEQQTGPDGNKTAQTDELKDIAKNDQTEAEAQKKENKEIEPSEKVTPYFIQDLAAYVVENYHPAGSVDNPGSEGVSSINFKSLNARYGLELIGMRYSSNTLAAAREEILKYIMRPKILDALYKLYAEKFINEIVRQARNTQKQFIANGDKIEKRSVTESQIAEMLHLNSSYLRKLAQIFQIAGKDSHISSLVNSYLQAVQKVFDANFNLNRIKNRYQILTQEAGEKGNDPQETELAKVKALKDEAAQKYRNAIRKRERMRKQIIQRVRDNTQGLELAEHEILSVTQWAFRRMDEDGQQKEFLLQLSKLFERLAAQFQAKAKQL